MIAFLFLGPFPLPSCRNLIVQQKTASSELP
jgi:hypothetical protein